MWTRFILSTTEITGRTSVCVKAARSSATPDPELNQKQKGVDEAGNLHLQCRRQHDDQHRAGNPDRPVGDQRRGNVRPKELRRQFRPTPAEGKVSSDPVIDERRDRDEEQRRPQELRDRRLGKS